MLLRLGEISPKRQLAACERVRNAATSAVTDATELSELVSIGSITLEAVRRNDHSSYRPQQSFPS